jgi:23S rRNA (guanosine2251-2'-O)-methyltransferase
MKNRVVLLENLRSAYNVGNIIRTADALWWDVWLSGYTPHPDEQSKVKKTSLGAEETVNIKRFDDSQQAIDFVRENDFLVLAGELTDNAISLDLVKSEEWMVKNEINIILVLGNEVDWVLQSTLDVVDKVVYIPMKWVKESLNVGQSAAIFMWELLWLN